MKRILIITLTILTFASCKKDILKGDAQKLEGTWTWKSSWGEEFSSPNECNCTRTLVITSVGKYEIRQDNKKIESGRITYEDATNPSGKTFFKLDFCRNNPLTKKKQFYGTCALWLNNDTLIIGERLHWTDQPSHTYIRQR